MKEESILFYSTHTDRSVFYLINTYRLFSMFLHIKHTSRSVSNN